MSRRPVPPRTVISRISAILLTFLNGETHSITEIAQLTGLPISTAHRMAADLAAWQLLHRTSDGLYRIGATVRQLGGEAISTPSLMECAPPLVLDLCEVTGMRARFGVLAEDRVTYIEKRPGAEPITSFAACATLPAHASAAGKAILAFSPSGTVAEVAENLTVFTAQTLDTPDRLRRALRGVRLSRIALARGELTVGQSDLATPVFGRGGAAIAALEVEVPDLRGDLEMAKAALGVAARSLSRRIAADPAFEGQPRRWRVSERAGAVAALSTAGG
jgi:DNA-binding IclR family transcriptional regulator